jgi:CubicO group peptidase (beta-lactamase class C family)
MTKSLGALVAMLYLAHKYGDEVFDLKIKDYVDVSNEDTFADSLNMTSGGAGVFFYSDTLTNRLAMAMDRFLKSREGSNANIWGSVIEEVLRPIDVFHAPMRQIPDRDESRGVPVLSEGMFPTYHDIVKIGLLLQNGGRYHGEQLLSERKIREALYRTEIRGAAAPTSNNPERSYFMSFWQVPVELGKCTINVSLMSGSGGKIAVLLPSGTVAFYVRNSRRNNFVRALTIAANSLHSECQ